MGEESCLPPKVAPPPNSARWWHYSVLVYTWHFRPKHGAKPRPLDTRSREMHFRFHQHSLGKQRSNRATRTQQMYCGLFGQFIFTLPASAFVKSAISALISSICVKHQVLSMMLCNATAGDLYLHNRRLFMPSLTCPQLWLWSQAISKREDRRWRSNNQGKVSSEVSLLATIF